MRHTFWVLTLTILFVIFGFGQLSAARPQQGNPNAPTAWSQFIGSTELEYGKNRLPCDGSPSLPALVLPWKASMARIKRDYEYSNEELVIIAREFPDFRSPAFQFYVNDFLGSSRVMVMEPEEVGGFALLLFIEWGEKDCGLPVDDEKLAKLSRLGKRWESFGLHLKGMFFEHDGRLYNRRLLQERRKQLSARQQRFDAAKASVKARKSSKLQPPTGDAPSSDSRSAAAGDPPGPRVKPSAYAQAVFDAWQRNKATVTHRDLSSSIRKSILLWAKEYSAEELVDAIDNYAEVLASPAHWWTYKFTCDDFFRKGSIQKPAPFKKFLSEAEPLTNFRDDKAPGLQENNIELVEDDNYEHRG